VHIGTYDVEEEVDNDGPPSQNSKVVILATGMTTRYILFDLANLILLDSAMTETEYDELHEGHMEDLKSRMGDETVATWAAFVCHSVFSAEDGGGAPIVSESPKRE
jgi:hypothetical protein